MICMVLCMQIEDGCQLGSADEIATAVHQIFEQINGDDVVKSNSNLVDF